MLGEALEEFMERTPRSREAYTRALKVMPGGVSHNIRTWNLPSVGAYPIHIKAARGSHIWDLDENEYVDNWMGHMAAILGHNPEPIVKALEDQLTMVGGTHWGIANEKQVELAELVVSMVPSVDMIRFCCSGTEATTYATRLARGYTGKKVIIKVYGGWHGYNSLLNWYHLKPFKEKVESMGQIMELSNYIKGVPLTDTDETIKVIKENKEDLAALIYEVRMSQIHDQERQRVTEHLKTVKDELEKNDALLILDEIITGFRLAQGGAQEYFGVNSDLTTFGKILGGGMHVGAIGGRSDIMRLADPLDWQAGRKNKSEVVWIGGGTFSANPMTMTAGIETLKFLKKNRSVYEKIEKTGQEIRGGIRKAFEEFNVPLKVLGIQSCFNPSISSLGPEVMIEWVIRLLNKGIFGHRPEGYTSVEHDRDDVRKNVTAVNSIVEEMERELKGLRIS